MNNNNLNITPTIMPPEYRPVEDSPASFPISSESTPTATTTTSRNGGTKGHGNFKCETCGRAFLFKNNLKAHYRTHTRDKKYTCEICKKSFIYKESLKNHMLLHTNELPYNCDICGKKFRDRSNRRKHVKNVHKVLPNTDTTSPRFDSGSLSGRRRKRTETQGQIQGQIQGHTEPSKRGRRRKDAYATVSSTTPTVTTQSIFSQSLPSSSKSVIPCTTPTPAYSSFALPQDSCYNPGMYTKQPSSSSNTEQYSQMTYPTTIQPSPPISEVSTTPPQYQSTFTSEYEDVKSNIYEQSQYSYYHGGIGGGDLYQQIQQHENVAGWSFPQQQQQHLLPVNYSQSQGTIGYSSGVGVGVSQGEQPHPQQQQQSTQDQSNVVNTFISNLSEHYDDFGF